tara:strand:+ start:2225 stop:2611 length:387 start_codon:yes stop_codon:yes gene_type:complete
LFDSWFASSKEYEKLKKKKYINCHKCNSSKVEKTLMSPNVVKPKNSVILGKNNKYKKIKKTILEYQKFIKKNFKYVGDNFAHEARSIHYDNKNKSKAIYGSATKDELNDLRDEGIETQIIPWIEDKNN